MRYNILLALMCYCGFLPAQPFFEWSAGAEGAAVVFHHMAADAGGLVAVAETEELNTMRNMPRFLQSGGEESNLSAYMLGQNGQLLMLFDIQGKLSRYFEFEHTYALIHGMLITEQQEILLLVYIEPEETDGESWPTGYLPSLTRQKPQPAGYNLIFLSRGGDFRRSVAIKDLDPSVVEVSNLAIHPNGSFILAGGANPGKPVLSSDAEVLGGGGDFIMMLQPDGEVEWVDVISYRENTCCTRLSQPGSLSVAADGTIYLGGAYETGGIFSNGLNTLTTQDYGKNGSGFEAYIISYQPGGKINWIQVYGGPSVLFALQATKSGVLASHQSHGNMPFGQPADTAEGKRHGLSFLNKKGKVKWTRMFRSYKVYDMLIWDEEPLLLFTALNLNINQDFRLGAMALPERTQLVLASLQKDQALNILKTATFRLETRNEPILFKGDGQGYYYLAGNIFCSLSMELAEIYESLPPVKCYGGTGVLGRVGE